MRTRAFAIRNGKELLRDPLNLAFALGFPLVVLLLLTALQANIPTEIFPITTLAPGIIIFGFSFFALFSGMLLAKDRSTSFLIRLMASPLTATEFMIGYILPIVPMAVGQSVICMLAALFLGLRLNGNVLLALLSLLPAALLFIGIGLLAGTLLNDK
ncbi:MAG: ABC transporter permease, partial [Clostridia bacterium]|nr:ABC transporter permease [Clostridia bacterium]